MNETPLWISLKLKPINFSNFLESRHVLIALGAPCFFSFDVTDFINFLSRPKVLANTNANSYLLRQDLPVAWNMPEIFFSNILSNDFTKSSELDSINRL